MPTDIPKQYDPQAAEAQWFPFWEQHGYFHADPNPDKPPHVIMIPLPNVTGALHMGHALNGTIQDLLTRWRRMQGYVALWMPGTDHAGIATQAVVERRMLEQEGLTRHDIGREALVERIWKWKDEYEKRILSQLKKLGASCDWRRVRFTLDDVCCRAVRRTFFKMFRDGLIYRGKRLVNWDTFLQTAVADDEVYTEDIAGKFWTFHYPVVDDAGKPTGQQISFSTTRPETMLGDTAVCVHPTDERYTALVGKHVQIPLNGRLIPIIADALLADKELGTGCVKVTPAHDPNDYACGQRHLEIGTINILNPNGTINENGGQFAGLDRLAAREAVVAEMERLGCFEKVEDRQIPMKYSDRSKTPIEPYLSDQWFVKMDTLATKAVDAVKNRDVEFFPERYANSYLDWLEEKRDWCISRQLWWGHRIPIWTREFCLTEENWTDEFLLAGMDSLLSGNWGGPDKLVVKVLRVETGEFLRDPLAELMPVVPGTEGTYRVMVCLGDIDAEEEAAYQRCGFTQDPDVLDTWFSSALWPHATLGWPDLEHDPPMVEATLSGGRQPPECGTESSSTDIVQKSVEQAILVAAQNYFGASTAVNVQIDFATGKPIITKDGVEVDATSVGEILTRFSAQDAKQVMVQMIRSQEANLNQGADAPRSVENAGTNHVLQYFYPGSVLVTSRDIITLWVARMVLTGLYNMGNVPFKHVHVHPKIMDGFGQGMSKSKGNGVDPLELIERYGCDGMRFTIASFAGETQDVRLPVSYECPHCQGLIPQTQEHLKFKTGKPRIKCPKCKKESQYATPYYTADDGEPVARVIIERFETGRNFCNKLWNACRFALINLEGYTPGPIADADLALEDRWILSRLATVTDEVTRSLEKYQFDQATRALREFVWNEFCDWYLEMIKPRLRSNVDEGNPGDATPGLLRAMCQRVLVTVVDTILRLLHPFTPFITEELWQRLNQIAPERPGVESRESRVESQSLRDEPMPWETQGLRSLGVLSPQPAAPACIIAAWPTGFERYRDAVLETRFQRLQDTIVAVRNVRGVYNMSPAATLDVYIRCQPDIAADLQLVAHQFEGLAKNRLIAAGPDVPRPATSASFSLPEADGYVPLEGLIDREAELARQQKEAEKLRGFIAGHEKKLTNSSFVDRAPPEVVQEVRDTLTNLHKQLASTDDVIRQLSAG